MSDIDETYMQARDALIQEAEDVFDAFFNTLDLSKPHECKEAILAFSVPLAEKYCEAVSQLACLYYDQKRFEELGNNDYKAEPIKHDLTKFMNSIDYFCRSLFGDDDEEEPEES